MSATVYFHSSETMSEVPDGSVKFLLGASTFLGKKSTWDDHAALYRKVYIEQGLRIIRRDGFLVIIQTNSYRNCEVLCRYQKIMELLLPAGYRLVDEKVWKRLKANFFQMPFSHVLVFVPPGGTAKISEIRKYKPYHQGVWDYPQSKGSICNGYTPEFSRLLVESFSKPGDTICDPFTGTGVLLATANQLGRNSVGYEIDPALIPTLRKNGIRVEGIKDEQLLEPEGLLC